MNINISCQHYTCHSIRLEPIYPQQEERPKARSHEEVMVERVLLITHFEVSLNRIVSA